MGVGEGVAIFAGDSFDPLAGITAFEDGSSGAADITDKISYTGTVNTTVPGVYELTYYVVDAAGNNITRTRRITVVDENFPLISGTTPIQITAGSFFSPLYGVSAEDKHDGILTNRIRVEGQVDRHTVGTYTLVYSVMDSVGNETRVERTVEVIPIPPMPDSCPLD